MLEEKQPFDFKKTFLKLTEYTVPFGFEETLEPILYRIVPNLQKDEYGNYHITIGNSRTLFTSHLDTYSKRREKINHVIKGSKISTDGTTILGGDNKNGVVILLYMITQKVPGVYYFFKGEEGVVTGTSCNGSTWLLHNNPFNIFTKIDRAIAFDRRGKGSIVTKQRARHCCSYDFVDSLVKEFSKLELPFKKDYAYGTDSAVFMDIVPEITNISSGGEYEHSFRETTNINYTKKIALAACKINWENLPVTRIPKPVETERYNGKFSKTLINKNKQVFLKVSSILGVKGFNCINSNDFKPGNIMKFRQYTQDKFIDLNILDKEINIIDNNYFYENVYWIKTPINLLNYFNIKKEDLVKRVIGRMVNKLNQSYLIDKKELEKILKNYFIIYDEFKDYIKENDTYRNLFKFSEDKIYMDIIANQSTTIARQKEQETKKCDF